MRGTGFGVCQSGGAPDALRGAGYEDAEVVRGGRGRVDGGIGVCVGGAGEGAACSCCLERGGLLMELEKWKGGGLPLVRTGFWRAIVRETHGCGCEEGYESSNIQKGKLWFRSIFTRG